MRLASIVASLGLAVVPASALADAGAVRVSETHGDRQITVFTSPTPLRAGPVDVSVLVQDKATGDVVLNDTIEVEAAPSGDTLAAIHAQASSAEASNKLYQAAEFTLPHAGRWTFTVDVLRARSSSQLHFEVEAGEPLPPWQTLWPWFGWPFLVIALFAVLHRRGDNLA